MNGYHADMEKFDDEWVQLINAAKEIGLSVEQVRHFFRQFFLPTERENNWDIQT
ncbi:anti-repressor SinI family protein [Gorillibacterium massiliense]|uniref:anti-repressor SinI family protein n=1 Tax=Gorillibacterium massiliense TaxID=1280390 RepID=UPI0004AFA881|nr:anti-repressor SinI family protein [Gorillibacterium massiliense]